MINLLENKYKRKIRVGASNIMNNLNEALKDKKVHLRAKRWKIINDCYLLVLFNRLIYNIHKDII